MPNPGGWKLNGRWKFFIGYIYTPLPKMFTTREDTSGGTPHGRWKVFIGYTPPPSTSLPSHVDTTKDTSTWTVDTIDKLYSQIRKVFRLPWKLNLWLPCFGHSGIVVMHILKQLTQPAGLASLNCGTGTVLYGRCQLGSIWENYTHPAARKYV